MNNSKIVKKKNGDLFLKSQIYCKKIKMNVNQV